MKMRRMLAAVLTVACLLAWCAVPALADVDDAIDHIMEELDRYNEYADDPFEQQASAAFACTELVALIAVLKGCPQESIETVLSKLTDIDVQVLDDTPQRVANCIFRTMELLDLLAQHMCADDEEDMAMIEKIDNTVIQWEVSADNDDMPTFQAIGVFGWLMLLSMVVTAEGKQGRCSSDALGTVLDSYAANEELADGPYQQLVNRLYHCVEMLAIFAAAEGCDVDEAYAIIDTMNETSASANGAPEQAVNGFYRCMDMLVLTARQLG